MHNDHKSAEENVQHLLGGFQKIRLFMNDVGISNFSGPYATLLVHLKQLRSTHPNIPIEIICANSEAEKRLLKIAGQDKQSFLNKWKVTMDLRSKFKLNPEESGQKILAITPTESPFFPEYQREGDALTQFMVEFGVSHIIAPSSLGWYEQNQFIAIQTQNASGQFEAKRVGPDELKVAAFNPPLETTTPEQRAEILTRFKGFNEIIQLVKANQFDLMPAYSRNSEHVDRIIPYLTTACEQRAIQADQKITKPVIIFMLCPDMNNNPVLIKRFPQISTPDSFILDEKGNLVSNDGKKTPISISALQNSDLPFIKIFTPNRLPPEIAEELWHNATMPMLMEGATTATSAIIHDKDFLIIAHGAKGIEKKVDAIGIKRADYIDPVIGTKYPNDPEDDKKYENLTKSGNVKDKDFDILTPREKVFVLSRMMAKEFGELKDDEREKTIQVICNIMNQEGDIPGYFRRIHQRAVAQGPQLLQLLQRVSSLEHEHAHAFEAALSAAKRREEPSHTSPMVTDESVRDSTALAFSALAAEAPVRSLDDEEKVLSLDDEADATATVTAAPTNDWNDTAPSDDWETTPDDKKGEATLEMPVVEEPTPAPAADTNLAQPETKEILKGLKTQFEKVIDLKEFGSYKTELDTCLLLVNEALDGHDESIEPEVMQDILDNIRDLIRAMKPPHLTLFSESPLKSFVENTIELNTKLIKAFSLSKELR